MCTLPCLCWHSSLSSPDPFLRTNCLSGKNCAMLLGCPRMLPGAVVPSPPGCVLPQQVCFHGSLIVEWQKVLELAFQWLSCTSLRLLSLESNSPL